MPEPTNPWGRIDKGLAPEQAWSAIEGASTATSVPGAAQAARDRLSGKTPSNLLHGAGYTPNAIKAAPLQPSQDGTNSWTNQGGLDEFMTGHSYGLDTNLKTPAGQDFGTQYKQNMNPFGWVVPPVAEALTPTNPSFDQKGMDPRNTSHSNPQYDPTMLNLPDRVMDTVTPHPVDTYKESYAKGERGESTTGMLAGPAAMATGLLGPKALGATAHSLLPKDAAMEMANRITRASIGSKPESFEHGATPDKAAGDLGTFRTEGRQLKGIKAAKEHANNSVDAQLKNHPNSGVESNPMDTIKPVLDEAGGSLSFDGPTDIDNFRGKLAAKINSLSSGKNSLLKLPELNELKKWVGNSIEDFKEEPKFKNLYQNVYSAIRGQIDRIAPEVTQGNQLVQSLIQAGEDLKAKINQSMVKPQTLWGDVKSMMSPGVPTTLARTGFSSLLRTYAGEAPKGIPTGPAAPFGPPQGPYPPQQGPQMPPPPGPAAPPAPAPPKLLGPAPFQVTPQGTALPPGVPQSGMAAGLPESPRVAGGTPASASGAPANIDPFRSAELAGDDYLTQMRSNKGPSGSTPALSADDMARVNADAGQELNKQPRAATEGSEPPLTEAQRAQAPADLSKDQMISANMPKEPTHIKEGSQVSGFDEKGNLVSGRLEKIYPKVEEGAKQPTWWGTVSDTKNGRTIDLPANSLFDKLTGPPKPAGKAAKPPGTEPAGIAGGPPVGPDNPFFQKRYSDLMERLNPFAEKTKLTGDALDAKRQLSAALAGDGLLGFDSAREAIDAIANHDDFATRWEVSPEVKAAGDRFRKLVNKNNVVSFSKDK